MTTATASKKPIVKGLKISLGLLSMTGDVLNSKKPGVSTESGLNMACPLHPTDPHGVEQRYVCKNDASLPPFPPGQCLKGKQVGDKFVLVSNEDAKAARASALPAKTLDLVAHPYEATTTFASGSSYVFVPDGDASFYQVLLQLVDEAGVVKTESGDKMIVGMVAYKSNSESFVRLERWGNQLVLRELVRPQDVDEFPDIDGTIDPKNVDMARQLIDAYTEDFNPDAYRRAVNDRVAALIEQAADGEVDIASITPTAAPKVTDIASLLEQSLAAAKAKKA